MAVVERCRDCSIVLLCGIPSSGKTTFAHRLSEEVIRRVGGGEGFTDTAWGVITVHFDDYHPPDLREERAGGKHNSLGYGSDEEGSSISFVLKQSRQDISDCIKHFILMNDLGRASEVLPSCTTSGRVPKLWDQFVGHVKIKRAADSGSTSDGNRPLIILLDDIMHLHSMRHHYYQMARELGLGFAQIYLECPLEVSVSRNSKRKLPVPEVSLRRVADALEPPCQDKHQWEQRTLTVKWGTFDTKPSWFQVFDLLKESLENPVPPLTEEDTSLKVMCSLANQKSRVHQADNILRKCVHARLTEEETGISRELVAKHANKVRKDILEDMKAGNIFPLEDETDAGSLEFRTIIEKTFFDKLGV